jgi:predicted methyltransferase
MQSGILLVAAILGLVLAACERDSPPSNSRSPESPFHAALAGEGRSAKDRERDADRRPDRILEVAGMEAGMSVADLMAGSGWYTELLARVVGPKGRVVAHNSSLSSERYGSDLRERAAKPALANVELLVHELDALALPSASLDAVFLVQFYHDTYWMKVDRAAMNRAVFDALKSGGVYLVIDHSAQSGSGSRDVKTLHRVDEQLVRDEILAAGFLLDMESDALRNEADSREMNVFERSIRRRTDRFVLKFVKPPG